jgi:hypothetical protein
MNQLANVRNSSRDMHFLLVGNQLMFGGLIPGKQAARRGVMCHTFVGAVKSARKCLISLGFWAAALSVLAL